MARKVSGPEPRLARESLAGLTFSVGERWNVAGCKRIKCTDKKGLRSVSPDAFRETAG